MREWLSEIIEDERASSVPDIRRNQVSGSRDTRECRINALTKNMMLIAAWGYKAGKAPHLVVHYKVNCDCRKSATLLTGG